MNGETQIVNNGQPTQGDTSPSADRLPRQPDAAPDPFDPSRLRLSQEYSAELGVKRVLTVLPCRKPNRHEFVRVRTGTEWRINTALFEDKIAGDLYLVAPEMRSEVLGEAFPVVLHLAVTKQGNPFLWPIRLPGPDGRSNPWNQSALEGAKLAEQQWVRLASDRTAGYYQIEAATNQAAEPTWPDLSFRDLLELAFKSNRIDCPDHPMLKQLRGEA